MKSSADPAGPPAQKAVAARRKFEHHIILKSILKLIIKTAIRDIS